MVGIGKYRLGTKLRYLHRCHGLHGRFRADRDECWRRYRAVWSADDSSAAVPATAQTVADGKCSHLPWIKSVRVGSNSQALVHCVDAVHFSFAEFEVEKVKIFRDPARGDRPRNHHIA